MSDKIIFLIAAFSVSIFSCKKDYNVSSNDSESTSNKIELTQEEIVSIAYDDPKELTPQALIEVLQDFPLEEQPTTKSSLQFSIGNKYYLNEDGKLLSADKLPVTKALNSNLVPVYDIGISDGNKKSVAFICADERVPEVLAYVGNDSLKLNSFIEDNMMYQYSMNMVLGRIAYYKHLKDSLNQKTWKKIKSQIGDVANDEDFSSIVSKIKAKDQVATKSPVLYSLPTTIINKIGPLTKVYWEQQGWNNEYNGKLTSISCYGSNQLPSAGCGVIAAAQILAHLEPVMIVKGNNNTNLTINWPYLKQNDMISSWNDPANKVDMVGYLIKHVYEGSKAISNCDGTSTSQTDLENYLRQYININSYVNFSARECKASLDNLNIVMASGHRTSGEGKSSHAWVVDGYAVCRKGTVNGDNGTSEIVNRYDLYLHCNMGWGPGNESGWFLVGNDWTVTFSVNNFLGQNAWNYNIDLKCSPYARKK